MRQSNPGKVILTLLVIVIVGGLCFLLASGIVRKAMEQEDTVQRTVEEASAEETPAGIVPKSTKEGTVSKDSAAQVESRIVSTGESGIEGFEHCYHVAKLSSEMQENFIALYRSVEAFEEVCNLPNLCSSEEAAILVELLHSDCPEMFMYDNQKSYYTTSVMGKVDSITVPYTMGMAQYVEELALCEAEVARIAGIASAESTDYEKELAAYREYCRGTRYDLSTGRCSLAVGPLVEKRGKCDGISLGFKWIMDELGIPCIVISGDNNIPGEIGHAWNMVLIDGTWYVLDVTAEWSEEGRDSYLYPAFNISEDWQLARYTVSAGYRTIGIPHCNTMEGSYHVKNGNYISAGENAKEKFESLMDRAMEDDGTCLVQFESPEDWKAFSEDSTGWATARLKEKNVYGSAGTTTIPDYQVAQIRVDVDENSDSINDLSAKIDAKQTELEQLAEEMNEKAAEVNDLAARANEISAELQQIQQSTGMGGVVPERYRDLVDDYDFLSEEYNRAYEEYSQMQTRYNTGSSELQSMINSYNSMVR